MLHICTSTVDDGSMKSSDGNFRSVLPARQAFLQTHDIAASNTTLVQLTYGSDDYCRYTTVVTDDRGGGITRSASIVADALVTTEKHHALFLPLADCIGTVIHDPIKDILMLSHLGRHNLEQSGGTKSIKYLVSTHEVDPKNLTVWLSPAASKEHYPLFAFDNRGLHEVAIEQLTSAGVSSANISRPSVDTTKDPDYFSHSEFLRGNQDTDGRFAVVAVMR